MTLPKYKLPVLETARTRYKRGLEAETDNRKSALDALKFRNLEQWDPDIKKARLKDPEGFRPCLVVDKTNQFLRQVVNDERQNRPSIKVRPVDDKGDPEVAKVLQGIVRHIEDTSRAELAYDGAYEQAVDGGFGYFRILTEYCDERSFDQDIKIKRIRNRFQVVLDPDRQEPDGSDAKWGFIVERMHRDDFKSTYPKADPCDWQADGNIFPEWIGEEHVTVAEYFCFEPKESKLFLWRTGETSLEGEPMPEGILMGEQPIRERKTTVNQLKWKKITAKEVLEERDLPGKYIPIVEVVGEELDIEGKVIKSGLLKRAMEPQRTHNYAHSSFVESVALAPRAQWVAAVGQIEGFEELYRTANRRNISVLPYHPVVAEGSVPVPPPQRAQPAGISVGWQQTLQNSEHDISASMGMYAETTLGVGNANSGKQEAMQQKRGDTATFHFMDNLALSVRHAGRIILGWIPTYYDTERAARIIGEDGTPSMARLNPNQDLPVMEVAGPDGKPQKSFNLTIGQYDVTVDVGPGYMTKRAEAAEFLSSVVQSAKDPATAQVLTYLAIKNNDWAGADEATEMLKKLLPPAVRPQEDGEEVPMVNTPQGPMPLPQAEELIGQLMQNVQAAEEAIKKAGDLQKIEQGVKDEAAQLEIAKRELQAIKADIEAARRMLGLEEQLVSERLKNQELTARGALQNQAHQVQRDGERVDSARKELDGILDQEVSVDAR